MTEAVIICSANQWTGFYMVTASAMKELKKYQYRRKIFVMSEEHFFFYCIVSNRLFKSLLNFVGLVLKKEVLY